MSCPFSTGKDTVGITCTPALHCFGELLFCFRALERFTNTSLAFDQGFFPPQNSSSTQILPDRPRQAPLSAFFSASPPIASALSDSNLHASLSHSHLPASTTSQRLEAPRLSKAVNTHSFPMSPKKWLLICQRTGHQTPLLLFPVLSVMSRIENMQWE